MKLRYLITYFFVCTAATWTYVNVDFEIVGPGYVAVNHGVASEDILFEQQVQEWSAALEESVPRPKDIDGNCLPVAIELQKRIVSSGRIAFIAIVDPPEMEGRHAVVVYSSKVAGKLDSVIDNGYSTFNKVVPKDFLDTAVFGEYIGTCKDPDPTQGACGNVGLAW